MGGEDDNFEGKDWVGVFVVALIVVGGPEEWSK